MKTRAPILSLGLLLAIAAPALSQGAPDGTRAPLHYRITQQGSVLRWELPATAHTVRGAVGTYTGTIDAEPSADGGWAIRSRIVVTADSMTTGSRRRDRTMRQKTLETGRFPEIVFESTNIDAELSRFKAGAQLTATVSGDLTVHGKTVPVQFPVDAHVFNDHVVLAGSFPIHWKEFGLDDPSFGVVRVREPMNVAFRLRAVPAP